MPGSVYHAHGAVAHSARVNDVVGGVCALLLGGSLAVYRFIHLEHHRHTDEPGADPDHFSTAVSPHSSGTLALLSLPLRWATQDFAYAAFYLRRWSARPVRERVQLVTSSSLLPLLALLVAWRTGELAVFLCWLVGARMALTMLACTFAWLPHHPGAAGALRFGQRRHLAHHRHPRAPFYRN